MRNYWSVFLFIAVTIICVFWSFISPIFEFPDEQGHIAMVQFMSEQGRLPVGKELDLSQELKSTEDLLGTFRDTHGNNSYTYHPDYHAEYTDSLLGKYEGEIASLNKPTNRRTNVWTEAARYPRLYYDYESLWYKLAETGDIILRTYSMRIGGLVLALLTALVIYQLGLLIFAKKSYAVTLAMLVMLQPMYSFLSAGVNSDNLHNLLFAAVLYCGIKIIKNSISPKLLISTAILVGLDIMSKPQGFVGIPIIILAILIDFIHTKRWRLIAILAAFGMLLAIFTFSPLNPYREWINPANIHNSNFFEFIKFSVNKLVTQNIVWYWGVFKWLGVVLPSVYWQIANRLVLIAVLGLFAYLWKEITKRKIITNPAITIFLLLSVTIYTGAIYWFDWQFTKKIGYSLGVQARYFFPTISAQMALLMIGILSLGWNARIRIWLRRGLVLFIVWMQLGGLWRLITSYYDVSSVQSFITQASQYKPWFAKGDWWYLWIGMYLLSLGYLTVIGLKNFSKKTK